VSTTAPSRADLPPLLFVTGTDTGVGKTVVTAALASCLSELGEVAVHKPLQTGVRPGEPGDAAEIARLSGLGEGVVREGVRLRDPLAPTTAARREGVRLPTVGSHAAALREVQAAVRWLLVEGAGGLLVGLDDDGRNLADLAGRARLLESGRLGFVVVVRSGLGTLNHSQLTVEALRARGLPISGLVIGSWPREPGLADECNLADLPEVTGVPVIGRVPAGAASLAPAAFRAAARDWFDLS
jgi:dethiobiotin synthetase